MENNSALQIILAIVAIVPGVAALINQYRKNRADKESAERDDNREDFTALFEAARQLGDAGTTLVEPLTETIKRLREEMTKREREAAKKMMDVEMRLTHAERQIEELIKVNTNLANANERYESFYDFLKGELTRLAQADPMRFPKVEGTPEYLKRDEH